MTRKDIIALPDKRLRQQSRSIESVDRSVKQLAKDMMTATLDWEKHRQHEFGVALAAVQIGQLRRLIVLRNNFEDKADHSFTVLINPEIIKTKGEPSLEYEGCLSLKDLYGQVPRYPKIKIKARSLEGRTVRLTAEGFLARVLQHEIDHTNGILFIDRVTDKSKLRRIGADGKFVPAPVEGPIQS